MPITSFYELLNTYYSEDECRELFLSYIWNKNEIICDKCGVVNDKTTLIKLSDKKENGIFKCSECGAEFEVPTNCLFSNSDLSFRQWLLAIYFVVFADKPISSISLGQVLGTHQRKAWETQLKIFSLLGQKIKLGGIVEMDETYVGGKEKNKHRKKHSFYKDRVVGERIPMFGIYERAPKDNNRKNKFNGRIVLQRIGTDKNKKVCGKDVEGFIQNFVLDSEDVRVCTDRLGIYTQTLMNNRRHETVKHSAANQDKKKKTQDKKKTDSSDEDMIMETLKNVKISEEMQKQINEALALNKQQKKKKEPYYIRYSWVAEDGFLVTTNGAENIFNHFKRSVSGIHTSITRKYIQFYADRFCFNWNTKHLPLETRMDLFFKRMAGSDYASLDDIKPKGETGRISSKKREEEWEKQKAPRKLKKWIGKLSKSELLLRNTLLSAYYLELETSQGISSMGLEIAASGDKVAIEQEYKTYHNSIRVYAEMLEFKKRVLRQLQIEHKAKRIKQYRNILTEYELVQAIPNKRERMAEIKKRLKAGGKDNQVGVVL